MENKDKQDNQVEKLETIEQLFPIINDYIDNLIIDENINPDNIPNNKWNYILRMIFINVINPNLYLIKSYANNTLPNGMYIKDNVYKLYDYYVLIANKYNKKTSLKAFLILSNINNSTVYNLNLNDMLNDNTTQFTKKIREDSEESIVGLMQDKGSNAIAYVSELNNRFGWSTQGGENKEKQTALTTTLTDAKSQFELFENDKQLLE